MNLLPYLSAIIMASTVATILLAVVSYAAFKLRDRRRPGKAAEGDAPVFFHEYGHDDDDDAGGEEAAQAT